MSVSTKKKFQLYGIVASVIIAGIGITVVAANFFVDSINSQSEKMSRTVDWRHVHGLGLDPVDRTILYIATHGDFYHSHDGDPPFKVDVERADYMAFNAPPQAGFPLYSSGHPQTGGNTGLIKSTDGGRTWQLVSRVLDPPVDFHAMAISKTEPNTIMGFDSGGRGLFKTTDGGNSWETLSYPEYVTALTISPHDSNLIIAGTGKGLFKSDDGGKTWSQLETYKGLLIFALAFDDDGKLYASVDTFGLVKTDDYSTWASLEKPELTATSIAVDSQNNVIYVAGYSSEGYQEVYKIDEKNQTYELIATNKEL